MPGVINFFINKLCSIKSNYSDLKIFIYLYCILYYENVLCFIAIETVKSKKKLISNNFNKKYLNSSNN